MKKHTHLSLDERITIAQLLKDCSPFKAIARELGRDPSTISKEVRGHRVPQKIRCPWESLQQLRPSVRLRLQTSLYRMPK